MVMYFFEILLFRYFLRMLIFLIIFDVINLNIDFRIENNL